MRELLRSYNLVPASYLEAQFIAATTTQFDATLFVNPFFSGTYQVQLNGLNPNYNPPLTEEDLLNEIVTFSTHTYKYGFSDGMDTQRQTDESISSEVGINCSSPSSFGWQTASVSTTTSSCISDIALAAIRN